MRAIVTLAVIASAVLGPTAPSTAQQSPADLALVGLILGEGGKARAMIEDLKTRKQTLHRVGDVIGSRRLIRILEDRVVFSSPEGELVLRLAGVTGSPPSVASQPAPAPAVSSNWIPKLSRDTLVRLSGRPDVIAHAVPRGDRGFEIREAPAGGFFDTLRLKRGDVLQSVNGQRIGGGASVADVFAGALARQQEAYLRLEFERSGKKNRTYYELQ
jgi:type II secretory pathway component PulC